MAYPKKLTAWQLRHKALIDEALLNPDVYQELGYIRRDTNSVLKIDDSEAYLNERVLRLIDKYRKFGLEDGSFEVLKKFCTVGGPFDYGLIPRYKPSNTKPKAKVHPQARLHRTIYNMWLQQLMTIAEITDSLRGQKVLDGWTRLDDIQRVSKIVKRMNEKDPNRDRGYGPASGRRLSNS